MSNNVLLVEDSKEIHTLVSRALEPTSEVTWAKNLSEGREMVSNNNYDLVLLDMELPDGNGIELCYKLQEIRPLLPVFFLTSHTDLSNKVLGFSAGAEDYITKPFSPLELKARVEAKLKRQAMTLSNSDLLSWKEIEIDKSSQEVFIFSESGGKELIELTSLEFKILIYLSNQPNAVISRDDILDAIWGRDVHVYSRSVDTHVSKLRKKLDYVSTIIESVHGVGYKFKPTQKEVV